MTNKKDTNTKRQIEKRHKDKKANLKRQKEK